MGRLTRLRLMEVGLALILTVAALLFVAMAVWAEQRADIEVADYWARPTLGENLITAAYMTISNVGQKDDVLVSVKSPKAAHVEIHETKMTDEGVMKMRPLPNGLELPAGKPVSLKPGGLHVMVMGLDGQLAEGDELPLTLEFKNAAPVELSVPVKKGAASTAGHDHHHH